MAKEVGHGIFRALSENGRAILSLECDPATNTIVSGTELAQSQAVVALWYSHSPGLKFMTPPLTCFQGRAITKAAQAGVYRKSQ